MKKDISKAVIKRLPVYFRYLDELEKTGVDKISSKELSVIMHSTPSQIRQDLHLFGEFGHQGIGYNVSNLKNQISDILGLYKKHKAILLGAGNLGRAVATHMNFETVGFDLTAIFEKDEKIIGTLLRGIKVMSDDDMEKYLLENDVTTAFLCIPEFAINSKIDMLYSSGIKYFWNFSHYDIKAKYKDAIVENVHMSDSLMTLCYQISEKDKIEY